ncbi:MAG: hypothetical protein ACK5HT_05960 [Draconibacterium sp.]
MKGKMSAACLETGGYANREVDDKGVAAWLNKELKYRHIYADGVVRLDDTTTSP